MENTAKKTGDTYHRVNHFLGDVGVLIESELRPFGIVSDSSLGTFEPERLADLRQFCNENPDFHIYSFISSGIFYNRVVPNALWYGLGNGDANPRLVAKDIAAMRFLSGSANHPFFTKD